MDFPDICIIIKFDHFFVNSINTRGIGPYRPLENKVSRNTDNRDVTDIDLHSGIWYATGDQMHPTRKVEVIFKQTPFYHERTYI